MMQEEERNYCTCRSFFCSQAPTSQFAVEGKRDPGKRAFSYLMSLCKGGLFPTGRGRRALYLQTSRGGGRGDSRMGSEGQRKIRQRSQTLPHFFPPAFFATLPALSFSFLASLYGLTQKIGLPTANIPKGIVGKERHTLHGLLGWEAGIVSIKSGA